MQRWTNKLPDRNGYWWWRLKDEAGIAKIVLKQDGGLSFETGENCDLVDFGPDLSWYMWGDSPISEPVGDKRRS